MKFTAMVTFDASEAQKLAVACEVAQEQFIEDVPRQARDAVYLAEHKNASLTLDTPSVRVLYQTFITAHGARMGAVRTARETGVADPRTERDLADLDAALKIVLAALERLDPCSVEVLTTRN